MLNPKLYVEAYAYLWSWLADAGDSSGNWSFCGSPIVGYLQNGQKGNSRASNASNALTQYSNKLALATYGGIMNFKTFSYEGYDYIPNSIRRTFMGKASPWEIQETLQLGSLIGAVSPNNVYRYCIENIGVDCGGFVANYWGISCPHMSNAAPNGWNGISPRTFWVEGIKRRRQSASSIAVGDAAVFFKDMLNDNPDKAKSRDKGGNLIEGTGSEAFHIGVVSSIEVSGSDISSLSIAESSGSPSSYGSDGVNVRAARISGTGKSSSYVHAKAGSNEWIFFVAPPPGAGAEMPYTYGEQE